MNNKSNYHFKFLIFDFFYLFFILISLSYLKNLITNKL